MATASIRQIDVVWIAREYGEARLSWMLATFVVGMVLFVSTVLELLMATALLINVENVVPQAKNAHWIATVYGAVVSHLTFAMYAVETVFVVRLCESQ